MSLKAFHIIFIVFSVAICAGFGVWALREYMQVRETSLLVAAVFSLAVCVGLVVYGRWFLRKLKSVSYI